MPSLVTLAPSLFTFLLSALFSVRSTHAVPINGVSHTPSDWVTSLVRRDQCSLIEAIALPPTVTNQGRRIYGIPPEPNALQYTEYFPSYTSPGSTTPSVPKFPIMGTPHKDRYTCEHRITSLDRQDERAPAATGISCVVSGPNSMMTIKIIRNVHFSWTSHALHIPARIQWEIEALMRVETLGTSMVHPWGHWVDRATSRRTGVDSQSGMGEIYISILRQNGHTLRDYTEYTNLKTEEQRKVFLIRLKQVTVKQIMQYAEHDGIFHGDLNIGNIYIIPKMQKTERLHQAPLYTPVSFEARFTDWGYTRKVIPNLRTCDDPWLVPGIMVLPDREQQAPQYVRDYVHAVFRVPWQLMKEPRRGVDRWHTFPQ